MPCDAGRDGSFQYLRRVHTTEGGPFCYSEVFLESALFRKHRAQINKSTVAPVLDRYYGARLTQARQVLNVIEAGQESAEALQIPVSRRWPNCAATPASTTTWCITRGWSFRSAR